MKQRLLEQIRPLVPAGGRLLLGVSGGPDSMALLHLLMALQKERDLSLSLAHVHHGLRPSADEEAEFVRRTAARHGLPFFLHRENMAERAEKEKISVETAGRDARYAFFRKVAGETDARITTAHHRDDRVETVLLHLLRGTGIRGLSGMQPDGEILRPLLSISKEDLIAYLAEEDIPWVLDESNLTDEYFRNRLRNDLLPQLRTLRPGVDEALLTLSDNARDAAEIVDGAVREFLQGAEVTEMEVKIPSADFHAQMPAMQRAILRATVLLLKGNKTDLSRAQTEELRRVWEAGSGRAMTLHGLTFSVTQEGLLAKRDEVNAPFSLAVPASGELLFPGGRLRITDARPDPAALLQPDRLFLPASEASGLTLRTRQPGDRIRVFGSGGEKPLAKAMKDLKIRHDQRDTWPLLCRGPQVYWILGRQKSEETRLTPGEPAKAFTISARGMTMHEYKEIKEILLTEAQLQERIVEMGREITEKYRGREVVLIGILKGSVLFMADLARQIDLPVTFDFMAVSSYGKSTTSSGVVRILKDLDSSVEGKDIIIVEDIIDSGHTLNYIKENLEGRGTNSVSIVTLFNKPNRRKAEMEVDLVGFTLPDEFVVGYGLDFAEKYRNLPYLAVLHEDAYSV